jgi:Uma2 family endonuclease
MNTYEKRTRRWTRVEYDRLIDLGAFRPGEHLELIGGELIAGEPQGAEHYTAIWKSTKALEAAFGPGWVVRSQGPVDLDDESEPEPDVAVVPGVADDYRRAHPSRPVLVLEVAVSTLGFDREGKGSLYARAGLADYWVLNLEARVLEVYRQPVPDRSGPFGWRYARREVVAPTGHIGPLAAPGARRSPSSTCCPDDDRPLLFRLRPLTVRPARGAVTA